VTDLPVAETSSGIVQRLRALPWRNALLGGAGGFLAIALMAEARELSGIPLIVAPFGASCALVFGVPGSAFARPRNVIGGHLISAALGLLAATLFSSPPIAMGVGVGLAIAAMLHTDTMHPPAGANPIVVVLSHVGWSFLLTPMLVGTLCIVLIGVLYHRLVSGHAYP
jgi:CBS-domain-containing membrane protein